MAAATATTATPEQTPKTSPSVPVPFDLSQPPVIEGFSPLPRIKDETFKEKFLRKTKENPFVPIGELHKQDDAAELRESSAEHSPSLSLHREDKSIISNSALAFKALTHFTDGKELGNSHRVS